MNIDILQGKWTELKDEIQRNWSHLTNDELEKTKGSMKAVTSLLEEKYGKLKSEGQTKLSTIWNKFAPTTTTGFKKEIPLKNPVSNSVAGSVANEEFPMHNDSPLVRTGFEKNLKSTQPRTKKTTGPSSQNKDI